MKLLVLSILVFTMAYNTYAQDPSKKKAPVEFKERTRIKTKAQIEKEERKKDEETFAKEVETKIFTDVEVEDSPLFATGENAYTQFVQKNLNINVPVNNEAGAGKYQVIVKFVVMKDGSVKSVKAQTNFGYGMEKEAERVINLSNKLWKPAILRNKQVNCEKQVILAFDIKE